MAKKKLTEEQVIEIRKILKRGNVKQCDLAKMYNVRYQTISDIARNRTWRDISTNH